MATTKKYGKKKAFSKKAKQQAAKNCVPQVTVDSFATLVQELAKIQLAEISELAEYIEEVEITKGEYRNFVFAVEPPKEVAKSLNQFMGCCRVLHNKFVEHLYDHLEKIGYTGGYINYTPPLYTEILDEFGKDYMEKPDKTAYVNVRTGFEQAIDKFNNEYVAKGKGNQYCKRAVRRAENGGVPLTFRDLKGMPKFHAKHYSVDSYRSNMITNNIKIIAPEGVNIYDKNFHGGNYKDFRVLAKLKLPKHTAFDILLHRPLPEGSKIKTATITREKAGKYVVTLSIELPPKKVTRLKKTPEAKEALRNYLSEHLEMALGLDYAQQEGCVGSKNDILSKLISVAFCKNFRRMEARIAFLQHRQKNKQRPDHKNDVPASVAYQKSQQRIAKLQRKVANRRKDALEKLSRAIADSFLLVAVEDIDLRAMSQTLKLAKNLLDNGFGMFRKMLQYKLAEQGKFYVVIDKYFPSSQLCHDCGCQNSETKDLTVREWDCPNCGTHHLSRDLNAALNIRDEGIHTLENAKIFEKKKSGKATVKRFESKEK